jgi:pyruvate/2-oxoacid:ferredoxin oxidoreductase beta subunit
VPTEDIETFMYKQNRFRVLRQSDPDRAGMLLEAIREDVITRWKFYEQMANLDI